MKKWGIFGNEEGQQYNSWPMIHFRFHTERIILENIRISQNHGEEWDMKGFTLLACWLAGESSFISPKSFPLESWQTYPSIGELKNGHV